MSAGAVWPVLTPSTSLTSASVSCCSCLLRRSCSRLFWLLSLFCAKTDGDRVLAHARATQRVRTRRICMMPLCFSCSLFRDGCGPRQEPSKNPNRLIIGLGGRQVKHPAEQ